MITALGATMLVGLKAACDDLRFTADDYYDAQRLFDISVKSTLGLDEADISALGEVDGVEVAEGGYTESAYTQVDGLSEKVDLKALSAAGLNEPRVIEGRLPRDVHEVAVTQKYLDASGKKIGCRRIIRYTGDFRARPLHHHRIRVRSHGCERRQQDHELP